MTDDAPHPPGAPRRPKRDESATQQAKEKKPRNALPQPLRRSRRDSRRTRQELIDATIETIYDEGFGNVSSLEVTRKIGVSWGVIQYYFGSWEALLLEALIAICDQAYEILKSKTISGSSIEERLSCYTDIIFDLYGRGRYGVMSQMTVYLLASAKTQPSTKQMIESTAQRYNAATLELLTQVSPHISASVETSQFLVYCFEGLAMVQEASRKIYRHISATGRHPDEDAQKRLLVKAVSLLLDEQLRTNGA